MDFAIFKLIKNDENYYKLLTKKTYPQEYIDYAVNFALKNNILGVVTNWVPNYNKLGLKEGNLNQILDAVIKSNNIILASEVLTNSKKVSFINMVKRSIIIDILVNQSTNLLVLYKTCDNYTINNTENEQLKKGIIKRMIDKNYLDSLLSILSTYNYDITNEEFDKIIELSVMDDLEESLYERISTDRYTSFIDHIINNNLTNKIFITNLLNEKKLSDDLKDKLINYLISDSFTDLNADIIAKILDSKVLNENQIDLLVQKIEKNCSFNEKLEIVNYECISDLSKSFYNNLANELLLKGNNLEIFWFLYSSGSLIDKALKEKLIKKVLLTNELLYICLIALYVKKSLIKEIANSTLDVLVVAMHENNDNNYISHLLNGTLSKIIDDPSNKIKKIRRKVMKINEQNKE